MDLSSREFWALVHGILLGGAFLVAFTGGLAGFYSLRPELITAEGLRERIRRLSIGTTAMAVLTWLTVIVGTWVVYPWYREDIPDSPRSTLLANPDTKDWHEFAMEWKEHVAWIAPLLATAVAFAVIYYGASLIRRSDVRRGVIIFFTLAFVAAGVAGMFGAFITKAAPVS